MLFSPQNVIYGITVEEFGLDNQTSDYTSTDSILRRDIQPYSNEFKTLDSYDYSDIGEPIKEEQKKHFKFNYKNNYMLNGKFFIFFIATIKVNNYIYDLCINKYGSCIATVENRAVHNWAPESNVHIYSVGRKKNVDHDHTEEEEDNKISSDNDDLIGMFYLFFIDSNF